MTPVGLPVTLFSHRVDPNAVQATLARLSPRAQVQSIDGIWRVALLRFNRGWFRRPLVLRLTHDPDYYSGANWSQQQLGMLGYFARFPATDERRAQVSAAIMSFRFAVAAVLEGECDTALDPRLELIRRLAQVLDACLFTPSGLQDANGRVLLSRDGSFDPLAIFPAVPPVSIQAEELELDDPEPPVATHVAKRALVLAAVAGRGLLEQCYKEGAEIRLNIGQIAAWLQHLQLEKEAEAEEWRMITTPVGKLQQQELINCIWRLEGLAVLAWALQRFELPRYDMLVNPDALLHSVGFLAPDLTSTCLSTPVLRAEGEIGKLREQLLAVHWRLRDFALRPQAMDFQKFGKNCWFGPISLDWAQITDGDLAIEGAAIHSAAAASLLGRCNSSASERHLAINWVAGHSRIYSETDTST